MISSIDLKNIGPFESFHLEPGVVALIEGPNGSGKSTLLHSITSAFENSHDATIIRDGSDKAEIRLTLADGTIIRRTITPKGTYGDCTTADGRKVPRVESYLKSLASGMTLDPIRLATCSKKERLEFLMKVMPITFEPEEVRRLSDSKPTGIYSLEDLDNLIEGYAEKRADAKKNVSENEATIKQLSASTPESDEQVNWSAEQVKHEESTAAIHKQLSNLIESARTLKLEKYQLIQDGLSAEIDLIRADSEKRIQDARAVADQVKAQIIKKEREALDDAEAGYRPLLDKATEQLSAMRERAATQQRLQGVRDTIQTIQGRIRALSQEASHYQEVIENLRMLRKSKLESLPIPGIEFRNGDIYFNDRSFTDQLNEAERNLLAFQICAEFREEGSLPVFICDAGSSFDDRNLQFLSDACKDLGMQLIITRVANQEALTISTV